MEENDVPTPPRIKKVVQSPLNKKSSPKSPKKCINKFDNPKKKKHIPNETSRQRAANCKKKNQRFFSLVDECLGPRVLKNITQCRSYMLAYKALEDSYKNVDEDTEKRTPEQVEDIIIH